MSFLLRPRATRRECGHAFTFALCELPVNPLSRVQKADSQPWTPWTVNEPPHSRSRPFAGFHGVNVERAGAGLFARNSRVNSRREFTAWMWSRHEITRHNFFSNHFDLMLSKTLIICNFDIYDILITYLKYLFIFWHFQKHTYYLEITVRLFLIQYHFWGK